MLCTPRRWRVGTGFEKPGDRRPTDLIFPHVFSPTMLSIERWVDYRPAIPPPFLLSCARIICALATATPSQTTSYDAQGGGGCCALNQTRCLSAELRAVGYQHPPPAFMPSKRVSPSLSPSPQRSDTASALAAPLFACSRRPRRRHRGDASGWWQTPIYDTQSGLGGRGRSRHCPCLMVPSLMHWECVVFSGDGEAEFDDL